MQFLRGSSAGGGGGGGGAAVGRVVELVRLFSRKRSVDVRRINPKVPKEEAVAISGRLLQILRDHGPLTVSHTWNHAKDADINGLHSKTHMKIMLKWMTGRRAVKLSCVHVGSAKKFLYSPYSENSEASKEPSSSSLSLEPKKASVRGKKAAAGQHEKPTAALH